MIVFQEIATYFAENQHTPSKVIFTYNIDPSLYNINNLSFKEIQFDYLNKKRRKNNNMIKSASCTYIKNTCPT
jgi:hypothetical protein